LDRFLSCAKRKVLTGVEPRSEFWRDTCFSSTALVV
jgi:hypothetical protein